MNGNGTSFQLEIYNSIQTTKFVIKYDLLYS